MSRRLKDVTQHLQRYGYNEALAAEKKQLLSERFAEIVRASIPEATDVQISSLQDSLTNQGEIRLMSVYDVNPVKPFMSLLPVRRR